MREIDHLRHQRTPGRPTRAIQVYEGDGRSTESRVAAERDRRRTLRLTFGWPPNYRALLGAAYTDRIARRTSWPRRCASLVNRDGEFAALVSFGARPWVRFAAFHRCAADCTLLEEYASRGTSSHAVRVQLGLLIPQLVVRASPAMADVADDLLVEGLPLARWIERVLGHSLRW